MSTSGYVAVIADVIASRAMAAPRRARLQRDLRALVADFNHRWRPQLAARFAVTLGDELQCLLRNPGAVWEIAHTLRARFDGVDWVVACGAGPVTTALTRGITAPEVDGPCFHAARSAMEQGKKRRLLFAFAGFGDRQEELEGVASYYSAVYWCWTGRQRRAAALLRTGEPREAARRLAVDRSAVSHLARRMAWPLVASGDTMFRTLLDTR